MKNALMFPTAPPMFPLNPMKSKNTKRMAGWEGNEKPLLFRKRKRKKASITY
jgi:hypothetical protein